MRHSFARRAMTAVAAGAVALSMVAVSPAPAHKSRSRPPRSGVAAVKPTAAGGNVKLSGWATFSGAVMASKNDGKADGAPGAAEGGAELIGADFIYRPENEDFFVRWEVTKIPSAGVGLGGASSAGDPTTLYVMSFAMKGQAFEIRAQSIGGVDPDGVAVGPAFGLFSCDELLCTEVAKLKGGYGTTGERVVVAIPLAKFDTPPVNLKVREGDAGAGFRAITAKESYLGGAIDENRVILDEVRLTQKARVVVPKKSVRVTVRGVTKKAKLSKGRFSVSFPKRLFKGSGKTPVTTKTCLGTRCVKQKFMVNA